MRRRPAGLRNGPGARLPLPWAGSPRPRISLVRGGARGGLAHRCLLASNQLGLSGLVVHAQRRPSAPRVPGQQGTHGTARDALPVRILVAFTGG
ncbi:hypothetical protein NDU88_004951 [Pleurodeles waltl]|uniref:Uncharacterized protein n=1 Tax=Pleurodeles waltl TaxID=8319 RepID=A0AAV7L2T8_PLEWA|nr:hypothetical protein NDU88_004951 [Pleurodeles waltl]